MRKKIIRYAIRSDKKLDLTLNIFFDIGIHSQVFL